MNLELWVAIYAFNLQRPGSRCQWAQGCELGDRCNLLCYFRLKNLSDTVRLGGFGLLIRFIEHLTQSFLILSRPEKACIALKLGLLKDEDIIGTSLGFLMTLEA